MATAPTGLGNYVRSTLPTTDANLRSWTDNEFKKVSDSINLNNADNTALRALITAQAKVIADLQTRVAALEKASTTKTT
uniref:hypothetical protein n=1 Tax=Methylobacterium sp. B34 TaxID=95563 RepID=UPI00034BE40F|nr:hypothetical protein [Methylobacterium sp. B34]